MKLPLAILAFAMILLVGACDTPSPTGDATPPGPEGVEGDY
jgi:hypothetical protein